MTQPKLPRGFVILQKAKANHHSIKVFVQNGNRYVVTVNKYFFGILLVHRKLESTTKTEALICYKRIGISKGILPKLYLS